MSALTASAVDRESMGSLTLHIVDFTSVSGDDTYASGLGTSVVGYWAQDTQAVGTTVNAAGVNVNNSSGTFTFAPALASTPVTLFIVSRS